MNWKQHVEKQNAKAFVLPAGWDSREKVAHDLDCAPERVAEIMRPSLKDGSVESQQFRVWNHDLKRVLIVTAYRPRPVGDEPTPTPATRHDPNPWTAGETETARRMRAEGKSWAQIGLAMTRSGKSVRCRLQRCGLLAA